MDDISNSQLLYNPLEVLFYFILFVSTVGDSGGLLCLKDGAYTVIHSCFTKGYISNIWSYFNFMVIFKPRVLKNVVTY